MNLKEPKTQRIVLGVIGLAAAGYVYFGTTILPFNYPVRKAKIVALEKEHESLSAEVEKARKVVLGRTWPAICDELMVHYEAVQGRRRLEAA